MDNQTILSIRDLRVVFEDGFTALGGVSIDIGENEFVTLLGPSGCGKTTLLRCIGGFEKPTGGEILYMFSVQFFRQFHVFVSNQVVQVFNIPLSFSRGRKKGIVFIPPSLTDFPVCHSQNHGFSGQSPGNVIAVFIKRYNQDHQQDYSGGNGAGPVKHFL